MARTVLGVQGALLSGFIEPIYLSGLVFNCNIMEFITMKLFRKQALYGRIDQSLLEAKLGPNCKFRPNRHPIGCYCDEIPFEAMYNSSLKLPRAFNWYDSSDSAECAKVEITNSQTGKFYYKKDTLDVNDSPSFSRLSKRSLLLRYHELLDFECQPPLLIGSDFDNQHSAKKLTYGELKEKSVHYQKAKRALVETFEELELGKWKRTGDGKFDQFVI